MAGLFSRSCCNGGGFGVVFCLEEEMGKENRDAGDKDVI
jgi:hypothetical protein